MATQLELSGYSNEKKILAQRFRRGGRWVYTIALPLPLVPSHLPVPDPENKLPGNRRVEKRRAEKFGQYWREKEKRVAPPLLLDTTYPLSDPNNFDVLYEVAGVEVGVLTIPHNMASEVDILDGQHRTLGWALALQDIADELKQARTRLLGSKAAEDEIGVATWQAKVDELTAEQKRFASEFATLEIMEGVTEDDHKQLFTDIAVNARGITKSITTSFDRRNKLNRVAMDIAESIDLLDGRVDFEKDRVTGKNENFISASNLVDIVRHVAVGIDGRMTVGREDRMKDGAIADMVELFFDALTKSFDEMRELVDDEIGPVELRAKSLLGSVTILRVLAGAYHTLAVDITDDSKPHVTEKGDKKARELFAHLNGHMGYPIEDGWFNTGYFDDKNSKAPSSRSQHLKSLSADIAQWGEDGAPF
ncbi:DGQHR domain-containing protein [Cellulosimicrobium cellulans]|uniref:DNA sulfur modification protein DndB n=1 Tax=Cellulosimicrobium cellulans TaxID=1710 RepID=UPI001883CC75|nr:DNA sulfur modification protein DndB [Cellulosimicrobium cellulans]MBE9924467.1 DGQHR domain-containing protein [Cellulosimicrobium cellulans]